MKIETPELKPCPFCGAMAFGDKEDGGFRIECDGIMGATLPGGQGYCGASVWGETENEAVTAWNRRMPDTSRDAAIRSESAALLKMCGEALEQIASDDYMFSIHEIARVALAALGEAGVKV